MTSRLPYVFAALPIVVIVAVFTAPRIPPAWRNLYLLAAIGGALAAIVTLTVREVHRQERLQGLAASKPGFSRKIEALASTLRAHAEAIEEAKRLGDEPPEPPPTMPAVLKELRRIVREQDHRELLATFDLNRAGVGQLRNAAGELEVYAQDIRARGGVFKLGPTQLLLGGLLLAAAFAWGCWLIWRTWDTPSWSFFGGVILAVGAAGISYGLIKSQRDPA